jgi:hypothetical protein
MPLATIQRWSPYSVDSPSPPTLFRHSPAFNTCRAAEKMPQVQPFDREIKALGGTTSALGLRKDAVQASKRLERSTSEQRMVDLVRINCALRRELHFFRQEYEVSQILVRGLHSISSQMYLNYFEDDAHRLHSRWFSQAQEIERYLQHYGEVIRKAESDFIELSMYQAERDTSDWI